MEYNENAMKSNGFNSWWVGEGSYVVAVPCRMGAGVNVTPLQAPRVNLAGASSSISYYMFSVRTPAYFVGRNKKKF